MSTFFWILIAVTAVVLICRYGPLVEDYYADARQAKRVVEAADGFRMQAVRDGNAERMTEIALAHPMPQRPAPPAAEPGEPWQLPGSDRVAQGLDDLFLRLGPPPAPGLVEPGAPNTLNGEL